jgi:Mitochondrial carrier protein
MNQVGQQSEKENGSNHENSVEMMVERDEQAAATADEPVPFDFNRSLVAGVISGAAASILCAPLDLIKTRLQVYSLVVVQESVAGTAASRPLTSTTLWRLWRDMAAEGWRGYFRGLPATLVTVPAFWGVYCKSRSCQAWFRAIVFF